MCWRRKAVLSPVLWQSDSKNHLFIIYLKENIPEKSKLIHQQKRHRHEILKWNLQKHVPSNLTWNLPPRNRYKLRLLGLYILLGGFFVPFWAMASKRFDKRHTLAIATSIQCLGADLKVDLFWKEMNCASSIMLVHVHRPLFIRRRRRNIVLSVLIIHYVSNFRWLLHWKQNGELHQKHWGLLPCW